jgi:hypothetical protein
MKTHEKMAVGAMTALGLAVAAVVVLPGPPARADATPPAYVDARTFLTRLEFEREGSSWLCRGRCRGAFADGGGAKGLWLPVGGGYLSNGTIGGCATALVALCTSDAVANAPTE